MRGNDILSNTGHARMKDNTNRVIQTLHAHTCLTWKGMVASRVLYDHCRMIYWYHPCELPPLSQQLEWYAVTQISWQMNTTPLKIMLLTN